MHQKILKTTCKVFLKFQVNEIEKQREEMQTDILISAISDNLGRKYPWVIYIFRCNTRTDVKKAQNGNPVCQFRKNSLLSTRKR